MKCHNHKLSGLPERPTVNYEDTLLLGELQGFRGHPPGRGCEWGALRSDFSHMRPHSLLHKGEGLCLDNYETLLKELKKI